MDAEKVVRLPCQFSRSGFPAERIFHIPAPGGGTFTGAAPLEYCFSNDGATPPEEPPRGKRVDGYVIGVTIGPAKSGNAVRVYLPDGNIYEVSADVVDRSAEGTHVPVKS